MASSINNFSSAKEKGCIGIVASTASASSTTLSPENLEFSARILMDNLFSFTSFSKEDSQLTLQELIEKKFDIPNLKMGKEKIFQAINNITNPKVKITLTLLYKQCSESILNTSIGVILQAYSKKNSFLKAIESFVTYAQSISLNQNQNLLNLLLTKELHTKEVSLNLALFWVASDFFESLGISLTSPEHQSSFFLKSIKMLEILDPGEYVTSSENRLKELQKFSFTKQELQEVVKKAKTKKLNPKQIQDFFKDLESLFKNMPSVDYLSKPLKEVLQLSQLLKNSDQKTFEEVPLEKFLNIKSKKTKTKQTVVYSSIFHAYTLKILPTVTFGQNLLTGQFKQYYESYSAFMDLIRDSEDYKLAMHRFPEEDFEFLESEELFFQEFMIQSLEFSKYLLNLELLNRSIKDFYEQGKLDIDLTTIKVLKIQGYLNSIKRHIKELKRCGRRTFNQFSKIKKLMEKFYSLVDSDSNISESAKEQLREKRGAFFLSAVVYNSIVDKSNNIYSIFFKQIGFYTDLMTSFLKILQPDKPLGWEPSLEEQEILINGSAKESLRKTKSSKKAVPKSQDLSSSKAIETRESESEDEVVLESEQELLSSLKELQVRQPEHLSPLVYRGIRRAYNKSVALIKKDHPQEPWLRQKLKEVEPHALLAIQNLLKIAHLIKNESYEDLSFYMQMLLLDIHTGVESYLSTQFLLKHPDQELSKEHDLYKLAVQSGILDTKNRDLVRFLLDYKDANFASRFPERMEKIAKPGLSHQLMRDSRKNKNLDKDTAKSMLEQLSKDVSTFLGLILGDNEYTTDLKALLVEAVHKQKAFSETEKAPPQQTNDMKQLEKTIDVCREKIRKDKDNKYNIHLKEALFLMEQALKAKKHRQQALQVGVNDMEFSFMRGELLLEKALEQVFNYLHLNKYEFSVPDHNFDFYLEVLDIPESLKAREDLLESVKECNLGVKHHYFALNGSEKGTTSRLYKQTLQAQKQRMLALSQEEGFQIQGQKAYPDRQTLDHKLRDLMTVIHELLI